MSAEQMSAEHSQKTRRVQPGERIRVVELLATGTNGGAQESVVNTMSRLDATRHEAIVISLSHGSTVARLRKLGFVAEVIEDPSDAREIGRAHV